MPNLSHATAPRVLDRERRFSVFQQLLRIAFMKNLEHRNDLDLKLIVAYLRQLEYFQKLSKPTIELLSQYVTLATFEPNTPVYYQGDSISDNDFMLVILEGNIKQFTSLDYVINATTGEHFKKWFKRTRPDEAITFGSCTESSQPGQVVGQTLACLAITRENIMYCVKYSSERSLHEDVVEYLRINSNIRGHAMETQIAEFLETYSMFQQFSRECNMKFANLMQLRQFQKGDVIMRQFDGDVLYLIVLSGQIEVHATLPIALNCQLKKTGNSNEPNSMLNIDKSSEFTKLYGESIVKLYAGDDYGRFAVLRPGATPGATLRCDAATRIAYLTTEQFKRTIDQYKIKVQAPGNYELFNSSLSKRHGELLYTMQQQLLFGLAGIFFQQFEPWTLNELCRFATLKTIFHGDALIRKDYTCKNVYVILQGSVKTASEDEAHMESPSNFGNSLENTYQCGACFGQDFENDISNFTAVVAEDSQMLSLPVDKAKKVLKSVGPISFSPIKLLSYFSVNIAFRPLGWSTSISKLFEKHSMFAGCDAIEISKVISCMQTRIIPESSALWVHNDMAEQISFIVLSGSISIRKPGGLSSPSKHEEGGQHMPKKPLVREGSSKNSISTRKRKNRTRPAARGGFVSPTLQLGEEVQVLQPGQSYGNISFEKCEARQEHSAIATKASEIVFFSASMYKELDESVDFSESEAAEVSFGLSTLQENRLDSQVKAISNLLRRLPGFMLYSWERINKISKVAVSVKPVANSLLCRQGEYGSAFYFILHGKVFAYKKKKEDKEGDEVRSPMAARKSILPENDFESAKSATLRRSSISAKLNIASIHAVSKARSKWKIGTQSALTQLEPTSHNRHGQLVHVLGPGNMLGGCSNENLICSNEWTCLSAVGTEVLMLPFEDVYLAMATQGLTFQGKLGINMHSRVAKDRWEFAIRQVINDMSQSSIWASVINCSHEQKVKNIFQIVEQCQIFSDIDVNLKQEICLRLSEQTHEAGDMIVHRGEKVEYFYLLLGGTLGVFSRLCNELNQNHTILTEGQSFGGYEIMAKCQHRHASVRAISNCRLLRMHKSTFVNLWPKKSRIQEKMNALAKYDIFHDLDHEKKSILYYAMRVLEYRRSIVLAQANTPGETLYIIESGECTIVRAIHLVKCDQAKEEHLMLNTDVSVIGAGSVIYRDAGSEDNIVVASSTLRCYSWNIGSSASISKILGRNATKTLTKRIIMQSKVRSVHTTNFTNFATSLTEKKNGSQPKPTIVTGPRTKLQTAKLPVFISHRDVHHTTKGGGVQAKFHDSNPMIPSFMKNKTMSALSQASCMHGSFGISHNNRKAS